MRSWFRPRRSPPLLAELQALSDGLAAFLFEQPGIGQIAIDRSGGIVRANAAARSLLGEQADLSAGSPVGVLFAEVGREAVASEIAACLRGQASRPVFASVLRAGATVGVTAVALRERDGPVCGALLRLADLSAQRQLETQLAQAQKLQAVGQLAGGIAHDFNNLLTAILGAAETVATHSALPAEVADDVAQIRASAGRGAALVRQLLAFGRQQTLQPRVLGLSDVIADVSGLLRRLLGSQIRLDLELDHPGGRVRADPTQLDQVLLNLAVNARDAMPDGGILTIRTGQLTLRRAQTRGAEAIAPGRYVMVEVADTGTGIAPDILPRIFDPFFTTRRESGGTGLGLSTVHGIIRQSDGFLDVESAVGQGTRLRIYLPRVDDLEVAIPEPPRAASGGREVASPGGTPPDVTGPPVAASRGRVLLVDDEEPVRRLAERALARAGWCVLAAEGGEQALAMLAAHPGPLAGIVTDMAMHGMDGVQVVREARALTGQPALPALLMSGYAEASLREALAGQSGVAFLAKPYALRELVDAFAATAADQPSLFTFSREQSNLSVAISQAPNV